MTWRRWVVLASVCAVGCWLAWRAFEDPANGPPARQPVAEAAVAPPVQEVRSERAPVDRAPGRLLVSVRDAGGAPASGQLIWTTSPGPPAPWMMLAAYGAGPPPEAQRLAHDGRGRIEIPSGHWAWLCATDAAAGGVAYARVAPFVGERALVLRLAAATRTLHVFVREADLVTPAARSEVRVYHTQMGVAGQPELVATAPTDGHGYAVFAGLPAGGFIVCAAGSSLRDAPPHTQRVLLPAAMGVSELPLTLVVPAARRQVRFDVEARLDPSVAHASLFLVPVGGTAGDVVPIPGRLRQGPNAFELPLVPGDYELETLPLGGLDRQPRQLLYHVPKERDVAFSLRVKPAPCTTVLRLAGLERADFPVTVYPRRRGRLHVADSTLIHWGPFHWRVAEQPVAPLEGEGHVVASGKARSWISAAAHAFDGDRINVHVRPACRILVRWSSDLHVKIADARLDVISECGTETCALRPELLSVDGVPRAALVTAIVVPMGVVTLRAWQGGDVVWERSVQATGAATTVVIE